MINKSKKGFTLIELLVVIAIIGLLSTLAVVALGSARAKGRDARRIADVKQYQTALEIFYADWGFYPSDNGVLGEDNNCLVANTATDAGFKETGTTGCEATTGWSQTYIKSIQSAPTPPTDSAYKYTYTGTTCLEGKCDSYKIEFAIESPMQGLTGGNVLKATPEGVEDTGTAVGGGGGE